MSSEQKQANGTDQPAAAPAQPDAVPVSGSVASDGSAKVESDMADALPIKFPDTPMPDNMSRRDRMDRLYDDLMRRGLWVCPVCLDEPCTQYAYYMVAVDDPYDAACHLGGQG